MVGADLVVWERERGDNMSRKLEGRENKKPGSSGRAAFSRKIQDGIRSPCHTTIPHPEEPDSSNNRGRTFSQPCHKVRLSSCFIQGSIRIDIDDDPDGLVIWHGLERRNVLQQGLLGSA